MKQKSKSIKFHKLNSVNKARGLALNSSVGKESACNSGDPSSIPGSRRQIHWRKERLPTFTFFFFLKMIILFKIYFNWRLITLQYCSGFCHTLT